MRNNSIFFTLALYIGLQSSLCLGANYFSQNNNSSSSWLTKTYETLKRYMPSMIQELEPINVLAITGAGIFFTLMYYVHKDEQKQHEKLQQEAAGKENVSTADRKIIFGHYKQQKQSYDQKLQKLRQKQKLQKLQQKEKGQNLVPIPFQDPTRE